MVERSAQKIAYLGYVTASDLVLVMVPAVNQTDPRGGTSLRGGQLVVLRDGDTAPLLRAQFTDENYLDGIRIQDARWQRLTTAAGVFEWRLVDGISYTPWGPALYSWQASPITKQYRTELSPSLNPAHFDIVRSDASIGVASKPRRVVMAGTSSYAPREFMCVTAVGNDMASAEFYIGLAGAGVARRQELLCATPAADGGFLLRLKPPRMIGEAGHRVLPPLLKYMPSRGKGGSPKAQYRAAVDVCDPAVVTRIDQRKGEVHFVI